MFLIGPVIIDARLVAVMAVWFMVVVSLISAIDYFVAFWSKIDRTATTRRRRRRMSLLSRPKKFGVTPVPAGGESPRKE